MLWIDIATPKYALFFSKMIPYIRKIDENIIVTTRYSNEYSELSKILELLKLDYQVLGNYGGNSKKDKFNARLKRQSEFIDIFEQKGYPKAFLCGSSVEGVQTAYGLGIPVIHFADTPIRGYEFKYEDMTILSKLTIPLSSLIFHPFIVPKEVYVKFGISSKNVITYNFIDVCLWMDEIKKESKNDFRRKYGLDKTKMTILIREEEYKAHYVKEKLPLIYNLIPILVKKFDYNIVIMPRYESNYLKETFSSIITILDDKLNPNEFYPFIDLLIGGGGTMNLEASYFGIPVISTRSLWLYHDKYLIDNKLMYHVKTEEEALELIPKIIGTFKDNRSFFCKQDCSFNLVVDKIKSFIKEIE